MSTINIILRKDKIKKTTGKCPLYMRVIEGEKITVISLGQDILEEEWDDKKQKAKSKHSNSSRINNLISQKLSEAESFKIELNGKPGLGELLKKGKVKLVEKSFSGYFNEYLGELKRAQIAGTFRKSESILKKLTDYKKQRDILFKELDLEFLKNYEKHLRKLGNSTNTIHANFRVIRMLLNRAVKEDVILIQNNPFNKYKLKAEKTEKTFLTEEEIKSFDNVVVTKGSAMAKHKDIFVFACYAGGIRISDLLQLRWEHYDPKNEKVTFFIQKTKQQHSVKLPPKAKEIINKYKPEGDLKGFIFPFLDNSEDLSSPFVLLKRISSATAYINKNLKILAKKANINKKISQHISRHSYGTMAHSKGMSIVHVSKIMAHSNIATTLIYSKVLGLDQDEAQDKIFS